MKKNKKSFKKALKHLNKNAKKYLSTLHGMVTFLHGMLFVKFGPKVFNKRWFRTWQHEMPQADTFLHHVPSAVRTGGSAPSSVMAARLWVRF